MCFLSPALLIRGMGCKEIMQVIILLQMVCVWNTHTQRQLETDMRRAGLSALRHTINEENAQHHPKQHSKRNATDTEDLILAPTPTPPTPHEGFMAAARSRTEILTIRRTAPTSISRASTPFVRRSGFRTKDFLLPPGSKWETRQTLGVGFKSGSWKQLLRNNLHECSADLSHKHPL